MKKYNQNIELIINLVPDKTQSKSPFDLKKKLSAAGIEIDNINEPVSKTKQSSKSFSSYQAKKIHAKTKVKDTEINPWDIAHLSSNALGAKASYIEPNFIQEFTVDRKIDKPTGKLTSKSFGSGKSNDDFDPDWQPHQNIVWHLDDNHSQLKSARDAVSNIDYLVRIGHLDTGYSIDHPIVPIKIKNNKLQRNFVEGEKPNDAHDSFIQGMLKQPGHGTGTLGILAGNIIKQGSFNDYLGGAYFADVVCCRISDTVILMKTSAFADAVNYLTDLTKNNTPVHVVTMSMGGAPSKAWADAVNTAYDAGILIVTAAGNNINGFPSQHVVYPARFGRVIAACGATYDFAPYQSSKFREMQGCYGPQQHMSKALAAFTPNTPWASVETNGIRFSGAGTSSATPQIAAAAAIYYKKYHAELDMLLPWQRVEAIRYALFNTALHKVNNADESYDVYFGNGILQANEALKIPVRSNIKMTPEDSIPWFPILSTIFKAMPGEKSKKLEMLNTELAQLVYHYPELAEIIGNEEKNMNKVSKKEWSRFTDAVISHHATSVTLSTFLKETNNK